MTIQFRKYHALGNDYIVIDPRDIGFTPLPEAIRAICDRNTGAGSDGILLGPLASKDDRRGLTVDSFGAANSFGAAESPWLRIFNPDGSEAEKSGNGLRIFAKYLFEKKYVKSKSFRIKTLGGIVDVQVQDKTASLIRINMGRVTFTSTEIPVAGPKREVVNEPLDINGTKHEVTCLSIGNPH